MNLISVLSSVNKVALFFFVLVLGFVIYEFVMYLKENHQFKKPSVPQFDPNSSTSNTFTQVVPPVTNTQLLIPNKKNRLLPLLIACVILIFLGGLVLFYVPNTSKTTTTIREDIPSISLTPSPTRALPTETPAVESSTSAEVLISPTLAPSPTTDVVMVAQTTRTSTASATVAPTSSPLVTAAESLPTAGSFNLLLVLALFASTVVVVSLLF